MLKYSVFRASGRIGKAANNAPWIRWGETSDGVAILQGALMDLGYAMPTSIRKTGAPDGIYGNETYAALVKFQTDHKLGRDGVAGRNTILRLDEILAATETPAPVKPVLPPPPNPIAVDNHYTFGIHEPTLRHDRGTGVWNSKSKKLAHISLRQMMLDHLSKTTYVTGPNAVRHMTHYLMNTGTTLNIDLENMIESGPVAKARFRDEVSQAQAFSEKLPVGSYDITSKKAEGGYNHKIHSKDWYYAIGGYSSWGKGRSTVRSGASGMEYELEFRYIVEDKYNWDKGKSVELEGFKIMDETMGEFHRQGLAQEYICRGLVKRSFHWMAGSAIPEQQYKLGAGGR